MKLCTKCNINKEITEFRMVTKYKNNIYCWCKSCEIEYHKQNKDKNKINAKKYAKNNPNKIRENKKNIANKHRNNPVCVDSKVCSKCHILKDSQQFFKCITNSGGLDYYCKCCKREIYLKNKNKYSKGISRNSYLKRKKRMPKWANNKKIQQFYTNCPDGYHVDHIIPLNGINVSGLHVLENLQYLTKYDNIKKSNKFQLDQSGLINNV